MRKGQTPLVRAQAPSQATPGPAKPAHGSFADSAGELARETALRLGALATEPALPSALDPRQAISATVRRLSAYVVKLICGPRNTESRTIENFIICTREAAVGHLLATRSHPWPSPPHRTLLAGMGRC
jgi:hypothetical protein